MNNKHRDDIIFTEMPGRDGNVGSILLNRPDKLNVLTVEMCQMLSKKLEVWANNPDIKTVMITGAGDRAFCAGGDIRQLWSKGRSIQQARLFFWHEYRMNARLFHFPKPYISFLDGITMGGGAGVSIHGSYRIGTEKLTFAMPETGIGFFPDIGAGYFLTHCPGKTGWYLGLTGNRINVADAHALGLITHVIPHDSIETVKQQLIETAFEDDPFLAVNNIIAPFHSTISEATLISHQKNIDFCFSQPSIETIIESLQHSNNDFCIAAAKILKKRSPTSLKVTLEHLKRGMTLSFDDIIKMDFDVALHFLENHDFYEGVRALLIDKDNNPYWQPNSLEEVSSETVKNYFLPVKKRLDLF